MVQGSIEFPATNVATKKRRYRATSSDAYESIKDHRQVMYDKIIVGLVKLGVGGTFEEIAFASKLKPDQVWKRLSEMEQLGIIFNVGITRPTTSGRKAMVRQLVILKK